MTLAVREKLVGAQVAADAGQILRGRSKVELFKLFPSCSGGHAERMEQGVAEKSGGQKQ
jgi:hypothetical protein